LGTEGLIFAGTGSQRATNNRWGDYTSMAIDNAVAEPAAEAGRVDAIC